MEKLLLQQNRNFSNNETKRNFLGPGPGNTGHSCFVACGWQVHRDAQMIKIYLSYRYTQIVLIFIRRKICIFRHFPQSQH